MALRPCLATGLPFRVQSLDLKERYGPNIGLTTLNING